MTIDFAKTDAITIVDYNIPALLAYSGGADPLLDPGETFNFQVGNPIDEATTVALSNGNFRASLGDARRGVDYQLTNESGFAKVGLGELLVKFESLTKISYRWLGASAVENVEDFAIILLDDIFEPLLRAPTNGTQSLVTRFAVTP